MFYRREKVIRVWTDTRASKWWQNLDLCVNSLFNTDIIMCSLCVFAVHESSTPRMPSGLWHTSTVLPQPLSSPSLHLSLSTQHPHSVVLRVKDGSFSDTFDAWFTTVFHTKRFHIQKQRKQHHKTRHTPRPICKTDTRGRVICACWMLYTQYTSMVTLDGVEISASHLIWITVSIVRKHWLSFACI